MHILWIILLALLGLVLLAIWWPVMLHVEAALSLPKGAEVTARIRFFSGLFTLTYRIKANLYEKPPLHILLYQGEEAPRVLWRPGQEESRAGRMKLPFRKIWRHVRVKRLRVTGSLGVRDDAFYTALLSGLASSLLQVGLAVAFSHKSGPEPVVDIAPDFNGDCLLLNLEGIAGCPPVHIMNAILIWHLKNRKGQATVWHILSRTS